MIKTDSDSARQEFRRFRANADDAHAYISFIHEIIAFPILVRYFTPVGSAIPDEEVNQYLASEWRAIAQDLRLQTKGLSKGEIVELIRERYPNYNEFRN
jgi:hypothetical protein